MTEPSHVRVDPSVAARGISELHSAKGPLEASWSAVMSRITSAHAANPWGEDGEGQEFRASYLERGHAATFREDTQQIMDPVLRLPENVETALNTTYAADAVAARKMDAVTVEPSGLSGGGGESAGGGAGGGGGASVGGGAGGSSAGGPVFASAQPAVPGQAAQAMFVQAAPGGSGRGAAGSSTPGPAAAGSSTLGPGAAGASSAGRAAAAGPTPGGEPAGHAGPLDGAAPPAPSPLAGGPSGPPAGGTSHAPGGAPPQTSSGTPMGASSSGPSSPGSTSPAPPTSAAGAAGAPPASRPAMAGGTPGGGTQGVSPGASAPRAGAPGASAPRAGAPGASAPRAGAPASGPPSSAAAATTPSVGSGTGGASGPRTQRGTDGDRRASGGTEDATTSTEQAHQDVESPDEPAPDGVARGTSAG